jgi:cyclomaltodextrinase
MRYLSALLAFAGLLPHLAGTARAQAAWPPAPPIEVAQQDSGLLPDSISAESENGVWKVTFRYRPDAPVQRLALAGSFNGWNPEAQPMTGPDAAGNYAATITLGTGDYLYKFVADGGRWFHDPRNGANESDGHGGFNSVLKLGKLASLSGSPGKLGDGVIEAMGLQHDPMLPKYFQPLDEGKLLLRYRTFAHDVSQVWVATQGGDPGHLGGELTPMAVECEGALFAYWEATVTFPRRPVNDQRREYTFVLADQGGKVSDPKIYQANSKPEDVFHTPDWAKHAIWYQIFPERFRNGDPSNDPQPVRAWRSEWFTPSDYETQSGQTFYKYFVYNRMYGGDLKGVEEKLAYLKDLGVNAIYFNPVFDATSNHKYNATTYVHIDRHFGVKEDLDALMASEDVNDPKTWKWSASDRLFLELVRKARALGIRVIIDGVFNHVGVSHSAFMDVKKNGKNSPYADWFDVTSWEPFAYKGWFGVQDLPIFKKSEVGFASDQVKQHIFNVTRRWMDPNGDGDPSDGIDGWRLDVPNEVPGPFWVEWRRLVKSINPDAYITGEIWDRAETWLDGRHFDAVMNYQFAHAAIEWIANKKRKISASQIDRKLAELRMAYPAAATYVMQNLVDSHDTDRLASMMFNPDRVYDQQNRPQDNGASYDNSKPNKEAYQRVRLVTLLQMTYVGAPMIYYGDEVGMWGADDPTCRKPMLWEDLQPYERPVENHVDSELREYFKRAIALRNAHPALRTGYMHTVLTDDATDVWAFERGDATERVIVALNASVQPREVAIPLPNGSADQWKYVFNGSDSVAAKDGRVRVRVPAMDGVALRAAK